MEQRSTEWFSARRGRVTGSMVGAILGLDPNCTTYEAMRRMVRSANDAPSEFVGNIATNWGTMHEEEAREDFQYESRLEVSPASFVVHPTKLWLGASPDGYIGTDALLEIKCPFGLRNDDAPVQFKTVEGQPHYYAQMQIQMFVTGRRRCMFWQWTPKDRKVSEVLFNQAWIDENLPKLEAFYEEFLAVDPEDHLKDRRIIIDTPRALQMLAEYDDLLDAEAKAKERREELMAEIIQLSGNRDAIIGKRKLTNVFRAGSISYAAAIKVLAPGADLEKWRGKPSNYWMFK